MMNNRRQTETKRRQLCLRSYPSHSGQNSKSQTTQTGGLCPLDSSGEGVPLSTIITLFILTLFHKVYRRRQERLPFVYDIYANQRACPTMVGAP
jgi:hypothetical protein